MKDKLYCDIIELVSEILDVRSEELNENSSIGDTENWDSIHQLMIISSIERDYQLSFEEEELFEMTDIRSIVKEILSKLS